jgi:dolichol-phosphate mannosyltransferase
MNAFSVVLPVYNEGSSLRGSLERLHAYLVRLRGAYRSELIVVDDGSQDVTAAVVETFRREHPGALRFLRHGRNRGIGAAIRTGAQAARMPNVVVMDADLSYAPETIESLVAELYRSGAVCVMASPYMRGGRVSRVPLLRLAASVLANRLLSSCVGGRVATLTGMVRAYETKVLRELLERDPEGEFNSWIAAELLASGRRLREVPAHLCWPEHRRKAAGRISYGKLWQRTLAVFVTVRRLRAIPDASSRAALSPSGASIGTYGPL